MSRTHERRATLTHPTGLPGVVTSVHQSAGQPNIWKYVMEYQPPALSESVLYQEGGFRDRTIACVSVSCGCPLGCSFCGTGGRFFRHLTSEEIVSQTVQMVAAQGVRRIVRDECRSFQVMFMAMGEPLLNYDNVKAAVIGLQRLFPRAELLLSTVGPRAGRGVYADFIQLSRRIPNIGVQLSVHQSTDTKRGFRLLTGSTAGITLRQLSDFGKRWNRATGRKVYCFYTLDGTNGTNQDFAALASLFPPRHFAFTFSQVHPTVRTGREDRPVDGETVRAAVRRFAGLGYQAREHRGQGRDVEAICGALPHFDRWAESTHRRRR